MKIGWRFRQKDAPIGVAVERMTGKIVQTAEGLRPLDEVPREVRRDVRRDVPREVENLEGEEHLLKARRVDEMARQPALKKVKVM